jgi:hypothetical protein
MWVHRNLIRRAAAWTFVLGLVSGTAAGREAKLTIRPQKMSAEAGKYVLLPPPASLVEGDAVPWYEKAAKALPGKAVDDEVRQWLKMPVEQLPLGQVETALTQYGESLKCVAQATKCRECQWPAWAPGAPVSNLEEYRKLGLAIRLWARYEIAQKNYEGAVIALRTGFAMGRHLTQGPTLIQLMVGNALSAMMGGEVGEFVQAGEAPNLYAALAALPKPFIEVEKVIESENKAASAASTKLTAEQLANQLTTPYDRVRILVKRLDTDVAALQCVEAIRSYAASHGGQLPQTLAEITEVSVPKDPMSGAAFRYARIGAMAVLESATPAGGDAKDVTHYEITMKN